MSDENEENELTENIEDKEESEEIPLIDDEEDEDAEMDYEKFMKEMQDLGTDFSDLEDIDLDELKEMQEAVTAVKEGVSIKEETEPTTESYEEQKQDLISDFSDIDDLDLDELKDMREAIQEVRVDETVESEGGTPEMVQEPLSDDLESRIKEELEKKKEEEKEDIITPEKFLEYIKEKRDKIWYHALWYMVFEVEDHRSSKEHLYDMLKEVTSKSAIDPIPEHQFYFGLGYILRLTMNEKQIIRYQMGGKFKVNVNIDTMKDLLQQAGEPISTRPVIKEEVKQQMFMDFLDDDFSDI